MSNMFTPSAKLQRPPRVCKSKKKRPIAMCPVTWPNIMLCRCRFNLPAVMPGGLFTDDTFEVPLTSTLHWEINGIQFPPKPAAPFGYSYTVVLNMGYPDCGYLWFVQLRRLPLGAGTFGFSLIDFYHFGDPFNLQSGAQPIINSPGGTASNTIRSIT